MTGAPNYAPWKVTRVPVSEEGSRREAGSVPSAEGGTSQVASP